MAQRQSIAHVFDYGEGIEKGTWPWQGLMHTMSAIIASMLAPMQRTALSKKQPLPRVENSLGRLFTKNLWIGSRVSQT
jgi:hypothetical protein